MMLMMFADLPIPAAATVRSPIEQLPASTKAALFLGLLFLGLLSMPTILHAHNLLRHRVADPPSPAVPGRKRVWLAARGGFRVRHLDVFRISGGFQPLICTVDFHGAYPPATRARFESPNTTTQNEKGFRPHSQNPFCPACTPGSPHTKPNGSGLLAVVKN